MLSLEYRSLGIIEVTPIGPESSIIYLAWAPLFILNLAFENPVASFTLRD
jgi:hypothetical protein